MSAHGNDRMSSVERALHDPDAAPLSRLLDDGFREGQVPRLWRGVEQRALRGSSARRHAVVLFAAAALIVLLSAGALRFFRPAAPLLLASGAPPSVLDAARGRVESRFVDGSRIELDAGSRMEVLRNDAAPVAELPVIDGVKLTRIDEQQIEVEMSRAHDLNSVFAVLTQRGMVVTSMRNKANRLEELFVRLVDGAQAPKAGAA